MQLHQRQILSKLFLSKMTQEIAIFLTLQAAPDGCVKGERKWQFFCHLTLTAAAVFAEITQKNQPLVEGTINESVKYTLAKPPLFGLCTKFPSFNGITKEP